ncbi:MAG: glutamyl-tRNA reductase [Sulfolobaceae archaeon]
MNILEEIENRYFAITFNYKNIEISKLHNYYINEKEINNIKDYIKQRNIELSILQTCNRIEIYGYSQDLKNIEVAEGILDLLNSIHPYPISDKGLVLLGSNAIKHSFRVASGMESLSIGEFEIIRQFKQSLEFSEKLNLSGRYIRLLYERALKVSKEVRSLTNISKGKVGTYSLALELVEKELGDISNYKIAIVGAGEIASKIAYLISKKTKNVTIFNRTIEKAEKLAKKFNFIGYESLDFEKINNYDIVFSAINNDSNLKYYLYGPKIIVDLSVPQVFYGDNVITLEGLKTLALLNIKKREEDLRKAEEIINKGFTLFIEDYKKVYINMFLSKLLSRIEEIRTNEVMRAMRELKKAKNEEEIFRVIDLMSRSIIKKSFSPLYNNVKRLIESGELNYINLILEFFNNGTISNFKAEEAKKEQTIKRPNS